MHRSRIGLFLIDHQASDWDTGLAFWAGVTGSTPQGDEEYRFLDNLGSIRLESQCTGEGTPPRIHLDIETDNVPAEIDRVVALGARLVQRNEKYAVLKDPAGLVFCVVPVQTGESFERDALTWAPDAPLPSTEWEVVVPAPGEGPGNWSGAASALLVDGTYYLAYRTRRPLTEGRGVATVVASSTDGVSFTTLCEVLRDDFVAESFERPALMRIPHGGWRLLLSCATPDSKHWWIEALDADTIEGLPTGRRSVVLPGSDEVAVKDPVVLIDDDGWRMWVCEHPLTEPDHEDRMTTALYTSPDGLTWDRQGTVLQPTRGNWDGRGARLTTVLSSDPLIVLYDGRPTAEDNWHETTGLAAANGVGDLRADPSVRLRSPYSDGALRYATAVRLPEGGIRFYFEAARPDGAHDLVTSVVSRHAAGD